MQRSQLLMLIGALSFAMPACGASDSGGTSTCAEMIESHPILTMQEIELCDTGGYTCEGDGSGVFTTINDAEVDGTWLLVEGQRPAPYQDEDLWSLHQELCPGDGAQ